MHLQACRIGVSNARLNKTSARYSQHRNFQHQLLVFTAISLTAPQSKFYCHLFFVLQKQTDTPIDYEMGRASTSLRVFRAAMRRREDGSIDVSGVISRQCFRAWLELKNVSESDAESLKFRRVLTNHVSGTDGRCPFDPDEEEAILTLLRKKVSWPCFPPHLAHLGMRYRSRGFHERRMQQEQQQAAEDAAAAAAAMAVLPLPIAEEEDDEEDEDAAEVLAAKLVHDAFLENVNQMLMLLKPQDASYLTHLGGLAVCNFAFEFSPQDQCEIYEVLRYTILGRTACCRKQPATLSTAQRLCTGGIARDKVAVVLDMTAKSFSACVLAQNVASKRWIGSKLGECYPRIMQRNDLFRMMLAICGAFHCPGTAFTVTKQEIACINGETKHFDSTYCVDPESFLLVMTAKDV